jgi:hypothetical protein
MGAHIFSTTTGPHFLLLITRYMNPDAMTKMREIVRVTHTHVDGMSLLPWNQYIATPIKKNIMAIAIRITHACK